MSDANAEADFNPDLSRFIWGPEQIEVDESPDDSEE